MAIQQTSIYHFIGLGGIGMSALAEILLRHKVRVQGSDMAENANIKRLQAQGVKTFKGHKASNIADASVVVVSSAIKADNPELLAAKEKGLQILHRSDVLADVMHAENGIAIAGAHGKTSTTALVWHVLQAAGLKPGVVNGGILNALANNACCSGQKTGKGWMVVEADESDRSFVKLHPKIAVVTNIDPEHMENYGTMENLRAHYEQFLKNLPEDGLAVLCAEHPETRALAAKPWPFKVVTYGCTNAADIWAEDIQQEGFFNCFTVHGLHNIHGEGVAPEEPSAMALQGLPGRHFTLNALAALAVGQHVGAPIAAMQKGLAEFKGVGRRFSHVGYFNKAFVVDDYAHHPVEIDATIAGAKACFPQGKVVAVIQPHRYSRLQDLMDDFAQCAKEADEVIVAPVYASGEAPINGVTHQALAQKMLANGLSHVRTVSGEEELTQMLTKKVRKNDVILMMGAGDISAWARNLSAEEVS